MKLLHSVKRSGKYSYLVAVAVLLMLITSGAAIAQTKKAKTTPKSKKAVPAKKATSSKKTTAKSSSKATPKKATAKKAKPLTAAQRRKEAQRKKAEEARRRAALAEQRRREQAAREARARKLAFERGLRTETAANIEKDKTEGEDLAVRQVAVNALGEKAGTVVVMEAKTGRVVTMVNQEWALKQGFKPCSTIKLVTGVAGVNEKLIDGEGNLTESSMSMKLDDAIARSNNPYFQRVGADLGNEKMIDYAKRLGLGQKTGINAEGETAGKLPYGNKNLRIYSHADDFEVTPLQLAVMVTALSNGGKRIVPKIQRTRSQKTAVKPTYSGSIGLPEYSYRRMLPGMLGAAEYGTARRGVDQSLGIAGKTGSCIGRGSWVGLFASVAPVEDPKYAVVVITRGESERGRNAAAIAGQIYKALAPGITRDHERNLAIRRLSSSVSPIGAMPSTVADATAGDDEDDDDESAVPAADREVDARTPVIVAGSKQKTAEPGRVVRTTQSKPVFPPVVIGYDKKGAEASAPKAAPAKPANSAVSAPARSTATSPKPKTVTVSSAPAKKAAPATSKPAPKSASKTAAKTSTASASRSKTAPAKSRSSASGKKAAPAKAKTAPAKAKTAPAKAKTAPAKAKTSSASSKKATPAKSKTTPKAKTAQTPARSKAADKNKKAAAGKAKTAERPRVVKRK